MNDHSPTHRSPRTTHARFRLPRTWPELALYVGVVALIPLTLFALAHPMVVAAAIAGLCARPLATRLARRLRQSEHVERPSSTVGTTQ